jgi:hypothetical protein
VGGELVFEDVGEFGEALHFAFVLVDVLNGDDAAGDISLLVDDGSDAEADPCTSSVLVSTEAFDRAEGTALHHRVCQWSLL